MAYCNEYTELISAALDGALSPDQRKELEAHLASCPECAALFKELSALHAALEDLPSVEPPAQLKARIMEAVAAEKVVPFAPRKNDRPSHRWRWLTSAAVLAIVLLGTWSWKPWEMTAQTRQPAPAAGTGASARQDALAGEEKEAVPPENPAQSQEPVDEIMPLTGDSTVLFPEGALVPSPAPVETAEAAPPVAVGATSSPYRAAPAPASPQEQDYGTATASSSEQDNGTEPEYEAAPEEGASPSLRMAKILPEEPESAPIPSPKTAEASDVPPLLFSSLPAPSPETADEEAPTQTLTLQTTGLSLPTDNTAQALTPEEALGLVADYCFAGSGYNAVREDLDSEVPSAHFSLEEDGASMTGGTIVYTGEDDTFFFFECHWDDEPESPYHYSVHKAERYVAWQGEAPIDGEFRP